MTLAEYCKEQGISPYAKDSDLREKLGVSWKHVGDIASGRRNASPELARKIEEVTEGAVTVPELLAHSVPEGYRLVKDDAA